MVLEQQQETNTQTLFIKSQRVSVFLRALNNRFRQNIIKILEEHKKLSVTEIIIKLRQLQSVTSQHLAILRRTGIVKTSREGKNIYYELDHERLTHIHYLVDNLTTGIPLQNSSLEANKSQDYNRYEMEYLKQRTGATYEEINEAIKVIGNNWVNIIYYLRHKSAE